VIVAVDGERVASLPQFRDVLARHKPGDTIRLELYRGSRQISIPVVLARQPADS
jgi:S1-C subfamily serine protease